MIFLQKDLWGERLPEPESIHLSEIYEPSLLEESYVNLEPNCLDPDFLNRDPRKLKPDYLDLDEAHYTELESEWSLADDLEDEPELDDDSILGTIHEELAEHKKRLDRLEQIIIKDSFKHSKIVDKFQRLTAEKEHKIKRMSETIKQQQKELDWFSPRKKKALTWLERHHEDVEKGKSK